jgi:hypothetical protein
MAEQPALLSSLVAGQWTPTGQTRTITEYRDHHSATWYCLNPNEQICLYCALPARLSGQASCVPVSAGHVFAPRDLAIARHPLDMQEVAETRTAAQRLMRQTTEDGTTRLGWEML